MQDRDKRFKLLSSVKGFIEISKFIDCSFRDSGSAKFCINPQEINHCYNELSEFYKKN